MGYWKCPRCGGRDAYTGNVIVNKKGTNITSEIGDTGVYGSYESGGGNYTEQAVKCRKCGEILSEDNYIKSKKEKEEEDKASQSGCWLLVIALSLFFFVLYLFYIF